MPAIDILATMSMGPALIGEEIDDFVDLSSITLAFIGDDVFSFRNGYTLSSCSQEICTITIRR